MARLHFATTARTNGLWIDGAGCDEQPHLRALMDSLLAAITRRLRNRVIPLLTTVRCMNESTNATCDLRFGHRAIDYHKIFESSPALFLLLGANESFPILDASNGYLRATYTERDEI